MGHALAQLKAMYLCGLCGEQHEASGRVGGLAVLVCPLVTAPGLHFMGPNLPLISGPMLDLTVPVEVKRKK
jgi:hypothetical protein